MAKIISRGVDNYTHMVAFDIYQKEPDEIVYIPASKATTIVGIGRFNVNLVAPEGGSVDLYTTLDEYKKVIEERKVEERNSTDPKTPLGFNPVLIDFDYEPSEGDPTYEYIDITDIDQSRVNWVHVNENGDTELELFSPVTYFAIQFNGASGGRATITLN